MPRRKSKWSNNTKKSDKGNVNITFSVNVLNNVTTVNASYESNDVSCESTFTYTNGESVMDVLRTVMSSIKDIMGDHL